MQADNGRQGDGPDILVCKVYVNAVSTGGGCPLLPGVV